MMCVMFFEVRAAAYRGVLGHVWVGRCPCNGNRRLGRNSSRPGAEPFPGLEGQAAELFGEFL